MENYETVVKKAKIEVDAMRIVDPISSLPPELVINILLYLSNEDIFIYCNLVCKRWNAFIQSDMFWRSLLQREFGSAAIVNQSGMIKTLQESLRSLFFFQPFMPLEMPRLPMAHVSTSECIEPWLLTFESFAAVLKRQHPTFTENHELAYAIELDEDGEIPAQENYHPWVFLKLDPVLTELIAVSKFELFAADFCDNLEVYFADVHLKCLAETKISLLLTEDENMWTTMKIPPGTGCIAIRARQYFESTPYTLRVCFPSDSQRFTRNRCFMEAVDNDDVENVRNYIATNPNLVNLKIGPISSFSRAISINDDTLSNLFLSSGARLSPQIIARAAKEKNIVVLTHFLDSGTSVNETYDGKQLLFHALDRRTYMIEGDELDYVLDVIRLLHRYGADFNLTNSNGVTPLIYTLQFRRSNLAILSYLITNGADVNKASAAGMTPLQMIFFTRGPAIEFCKLLLEHGVDVNIPFQMQNGRKTTALILAVQKRKFDLITMFLKHGADVNATDSMGLTAFAHAELNDWTEYDLNFLNIK